MTVGIAEGDGQKPTRHYAACIDTSFRRHVSRRLFICGGFGTTISILISACGQGVPTAAEISEKGRSTAPKPNGAVASNTRRVVAKPTVRIPLAAPASKVPPVDSSVSPAVVTATMAPPPLHQTAAAIRPALVVAVARPTVEAPSTSPTAAVPTPGISTTPLWCI